MKLENLQLKAGEAERLLKAMASRPRLMSLCELLKGERTVTALHESSRIEYVRNGQHLARLRGDELRRDSPQIADDFLFAGRRRRDRILETLYSIYCSPMDAAAQCETAAILINR